MFTAEMSSDAWLVAGMAERGILPKWLGRRNQYGTPTYGILLSASGVLFLCTMRFSEVVQLLNLLFCFGQAIEFIAFVELRRSRPDLHRPYKIPLDTTGCCLLVAFPLLFLVVICAFSSFRCLFTAAGLALLSAPLHHLLAKYRRDCPNDFYY